QFIDNLTWTKGSHSFKFGENYRRELVNDQDPRRDFASISSGNASEFMYGVATSSGQSFPLSAVQPIDDWALDLYAEDTWQVTRHLTAIYGLRATHNS